MTPAFEEATSRIDTLLSHYIYIYMYIYIYIIDISYIDILLSYYQHFKKQKWFRMIHTHGIDPDQGCDQFAGSAVECPWGTKTNQQAVIDSPLWLFPRNLFFCHLFETFHATSCNWMQSYHDQFTSDFPVYESWLWQRLSATFEGWCKPSHLSKFWCVVEMHSLIISAWKWLFP